MAVKNLRTNLRRRFLTWRLKRLNDRIESEDALINGIYDDTLNVVPEAEQRRYHAALARRGVVLDLNALGGTQYTLWGTVAPTPN